jgi:hypothetical protein
MVARRGQTGELSGVLGRGRCGEAGYFHGDWCGVVGVESGGGGSITPLHF